MCGRVHWAIAIGWLVLSFASTRVCAQDDSTSRELRPLLEHEVVDLALAHAPELDMTTATVALERARESTAGRMENPSLSWTREAIATDPNSSQDIVSLAVPFDFTGPGTRRALAEAQTAWAETRQTLSRLELASAALLLHSDWIVSHQRIEMLRLALVGLEEASRVMSAREQAGETSGYDSARLTIARSLGRSRLAEADADRHALAMRLGVMTGLEPGSFRPEGALTLESTSDQTRIPPVIAQAQHAVQLARDARDRADWSWIPTLALMGGIKRVSDGGGGLGYTFGVTVSLPIFDRGQGLRDEAAAVHATASAQVDTLSRTLMRESAIALAQRDAAREELERFETETMNSMQTLLTAARSGYGEGALTLLELLDAERTLLEVSERRLVLLRRAKHAEVRHRASSGRLL